MFFFVFFWGGGGGYSIPVHRLELNSLSAIPGNKCGHDNTFVCFLEFKIFLWVLCIHTPVQIVAE